jgi:SAM-dependent methyltransferase
LTLWSARSPSHTGHQPAGLAEIARVLRPSGRLVLVDLFAIGWLRPLAALGRRRDRMPTAAELESMLAAARLAPLAWRRVYDLGPLPLVRAVVAACS